MNEINYLIKEFERIKKMEWVKSTNKGNGGIGLTFEKLLGIDKNELEIPDYNGIEIKTKRYSSNSYITLFSCKPEGKHYHEVKRIKDKYGYPHKKFRQYKVLNNSVYGNVKNKIGVFYYFKLKVERKEKKIYLEIYNLKNQLIEKEIYWDFDNLEEKLKRKLKILALIKANSIKSKIDDREYFKYNDLKIYYLKGFEYFINLLEIGIIRINFKLDIKTRGEKLGEIHDHGTSFDILERDLIKLYDKIDIV